MQNVGDAVGWMLLIFANDWRRSLTSLLVDLIPRTSTHLVHNSASLETALGKVTMQADWIDGS